MPVEVPADEIMDLLLRLLMQVLEFVNRRELGDVQTVGQNTVWLALEQVLRLECGDVRDSSEDVASVSSSTFNAVPVVNPALASLSINVKPLKVVVEINGASTKVSS